MFCGKQALKQATHRAVGLQRMPERECGVDLVVIPPTFPNALDDAPLFELRHDTVDAALGEPNQVRHITQPHIWIPRQAHEHVGVVAQERPGGRHALTL